MGSASEKNFANKNQPHVSPCLPSFSWFKKSMVFGFCMLINMRITKVRESNEARLAKVMMCVKMKVQSFFHRMKFFF
ncbi:MAG: hypothetical protein RL117_1845 [Verrucomicrobiota bacterium]